MSIFAEKSSHLSTYVGRRGRGGVGACILSFFPNICRYIWRNTRSLAWKVCCSIGAVSVQCRCSVVAVLLQRVVVIYWRNAYLFARRVCCSVLQCVAACCSVLHCVSVRCSALQCVAVRCRISESDSSVLHCVAECESVYNLLQCVAVRYTWLH